MSELTIEHTDAEGTVLYGTARGDGSAEILKVHRWRWGRSIAAWYIPRSRDQAPMRARIKGTVEEHTKHVLDELEKTLLAAGSSMEKVLKVNVYLNDINDWARMNTVYAGRWGSIPPVRTTVAPASGIPSNSLVEIDLIAYI